MTAQLDRLKKCAESGEHAAIVQYMRQVRRRNSLQGAIMIYFELIGCPVELEWNGMTELVRNVMTPYHMTDQHEVALALDRLVDARRLFKSSGDYICSDQRPLYDLALASQDIRRAVSVLDADQRNRLRRWWATLIGCSESYMVLAVANNCDYRDISARKFPWVDYRHLIAEGWLKMGSPWHDAVRLAPTCPMPTWGHFGDLG